MVWYRDWFGKTYHWLYAHRNDAEAQEQAAAICKLLNIHQKTRILDIACGRGRHAIALAKLGLELHALDLSAESLTIARNDAKRAGVDQQIRFHEGDMRTLPFPDDSFDLLLSLFTSFGYFETDLEHVNLLREWNRVLVPGGVLLLDVANRERALADLVPQSEEVRDGRRILQTRRLSADGKRLEKEIGIMTGDEIESFRESIRLFSTDEIELLLTHANYSTYQLLSDFHGTPFSADTERLIILAQK